MHRDKNKISVNFYKIYIFIIHNILYILYNGNDFFSKYINKNNIIKMVRLNNFTKIIKILKLDMITIKYYKMHIIINTYVFT